MTPFKPVTPRRAVSAETREQVGEQAGEPAWKQPGIASMNQAWSKQDTIMRQAGEASKKHVSGVSKYGGVSATAHTEKALSHCGREGMTFTITT